MQDKDKARPQIGPPEWARYDELMRVLQSGAPIDFARMVQREPAFPYGRDPVFGRHWLTNAIDWQAVRAVRWMLAQQVDVSYLDEEGLTPLMAVLDCKNGDNRYAMLHLLLAQGAAHATVGLNFFTAAHVAALNNDVNALRLLAQYGADLYVATEDFGVWRTPADVARFHQCPAALAYLEKHGLTEGTQR